MTDWSCIYMLDENGKLGLFALVGDNPPKGAVRIDDFAGKVPRYIHPDLVGTELATTLEIYPDARINSIVAEMLPSYSQSGSDPNETKTGETERS